MNRHHLHRPPRLADRLLQWLCKEEWLEPIKGDLYEQFLEDRDNFSYAKARRRYWINAFHFLRPFAMKNIKTPSDRIPELGMIFRPLFRHMRKKPGFYGINVLGLALGLTVVFISNLWIGYHSSFDDFHDNKDHIYKVHSISDGMAGEKKAGLPVYSVMEEAKAQIPDIEHVTRIVSNWRWPSEQCFKIDEHKSCIYSKGIFADSSFFKVFQFKMKAGDPNPLRDPRHIALSASLAEKLYGTENPIGKTYLLDNHYAVEIVSIFEDIPANSTLQFDFIASLTVATDLQGVKLETWFNFSFLTYVSLFSDHPDQANIQLNSLEKAKADYPRQTRFLQPLVDTHLFEYGTSKGGLINYIRIIRVFSIFILLISIVNFINLTTAHATSRGKEIGVRKVIGAGKGTLQIHFLIEIAFSVLIAAVMALLAAYLLLPGLSGLIDETIPFRFTTDILVQMTLAVVFTTLLSGLYPAVVLSAFKPLSIMKNLQFKASGNHTSRQVLTVAQVSISTFIILMSIVFYQQLQYMQQQDIGYDKEGVMILEPTYQHVKQFQAFKNDLLQYPEIEHLGIANAKLTDVNFNAKDPIWPGKDKDDRRPFKAIGVDNGLINLMGLTSYEGTLFTSDTLPQLILSRSAVKAMGLQDPVGTTVSVYNYPRKVVGVVDDFQTKSLHEPNLPVMLYPVLPRHAGTFYIRYNAKKTREAIQIIERVYDQYEPFFDMKFKLLDAEYQELYRREQVITQVSQVVMVLAIVIALIGILGLSIFNVARKLKEIGLRKVFGATGLHLLGLLSREFIILTIMANLIATPFTLWFSDIWLSEFAYRISFPVAAVVWILVLSLFTILGLLALQSLKVSRLNPSKILRDE